CPEFSTTDIGVWVTGSGKLDLEGTPKRGWARTDGQGLPPTQANAMPWTTTISLAEAPQLWGQGWYAGDRIWVAPSALTNEDHQSIWEFEPFILNASTGTSTTLSATRLPRGLACSNDNPCILNHFGHCKGVVPGVPLSGTCDCPSTGCFSGGTCV